MSESIPILDGHIHLLGEQPDEYLAALLGAMDRHGVAQAVGFGDQIDCDSSDALALSAAGSRPDRIIPFTCALDPNAADSPRELDRRLASEPWVGVGELFLSTDDPTMIYFTRDAREVEYRYPVPTELGQGAVFDQILEVCANRRKPVLIHSDSAEPMDGLLSRHPNALVIWAHVDWHVHKAAPLVERHPNLMVEIGAHLNFAGIFSPHLPIEQAPYMSDWLAMCLPFIEEHAGRVTFGSDHYEWRHFEPEERAGAGYSAVRQVCKWLSPSAAQAWLWDTLSGVLEAK